MNLIVPALAERSAALASPSAPPAPDRASAILHAARLLLPALERGQALDATTLRAAMEAAFGTTYVAGTWVWKDAYEACEVAQVLFLRRHGPAMRARAGNPAAMLAMLARLAALAPTHTRRSEESAALQQFSTPVALGFTTYATLRSAEREGKASRLDQIIDWLGRDFDGVIVFDEAHAMANAAGDTSERGERGPSQQGRAGLRLQHALPDARVLYVSATGATSVQNLAYAQRLGLWGGADFPFATRQEFVAAMEAGGIAAMEVLARDLKALGLYAARSLSYEGIEVEIVEHALSPEQVRIYDAYAEAFQVIHANLGEALEAANVTGPSGTLNRQAKAAARSAFESNKQRFFNHLITAMGLPAVGFFTSPALAIPTISVVNTWAFTGYTALLFYAGMLQIPGDLYESASLDGAGEWRLFTRITLPLLKPVMALVLVVSLIGSFQIFDTVAVTTKGGPVNATRVIYYYIYQQAFTFFHMGYAATMAIVLVIILGVLTAVQLRLLRASESQLA